jgi:hypothetical protein
VVLCQISSCDAILATMEDMLGKFQSDLGNISSEIRALPIFPCMRPGTIQSPPREPCMRPGRIQLSAQEAMHAPWHNPNSSWGKPMLAREMMGNE